jgi:hypothetical protein
VGGSHLYFHYREVLNYTRGISVETTTQVKLNILYEPEYFKLYEGNVTEENVHVFFNYPLAYECSNTNFFSHMVTNVSG